MFTMGAKLNEENYEQKKQTEINNSNRKLSKQQHNLVFTFEKRKGKPVTLVGRFYLDNIEKKQILKLLKTKLACGGAIKDEWIELQGNVKDKVKKILINDQWSFK